MTSEQFAYWLNGFIELTGSVPSDAQWMSIKAHLSEVFKKVTPPTQHPSLSPLPDVLKEWHRAHPPGQFIPQQFPYPGQMPIIC